MTARATIGATVAGPLAVGLVTGVLRGVFQLTTPTTAALLFLLVVVLTSAVASRRASMFTSVVAFLCFNYFFLPPLGTWTIADPQNWVALFTLLGVSLAVSHLAGVARLQTAEAQDRGADMARLFDFSRDVLLTTDDRGSLTALARSLITRYRFSAVEIALKGSAGWERYTAGEPLAVTDDDRDAVVSHSDRTLEFDARARAYRGQQRLVRGDCAVDLVPIRRGATVIGVLVVAGAQGHSGPLDALAGLVAIAIERAAQTEARRESEVARASDALKTTLLASLAHDLRTPLTAIRVAAENLQHGQLSGQERQDQGDLIRSETTRLSRLFDNVLQMARVDTGVVVTDGQRVHPSELIDAARVLSAPTLGTRTLHTSIVDDEPVKLDQRLVATAVSHLLDNAAKYSPAASPIEVAASRHHDTVRFAVRDFGPGIAAAEAERIFDPFYRVPSNVAGAPGIGLGLAIVRGLLTAVGGRVWVETPADGGSRFVIEVPHHP